MYESSLSVNISTRFFHAVLFSVVCVNGTPGLAQQAGQTTTSQVISVEGQLWCRQVFRATATNNADTNLVISANGTLSVYLNGQRLVRHRRTSQERLTWNVGRLLRAGNNCVAVAATAPDNGTALVLQFTSGVPLQLKAAPWKVTEAAPPVGWQQTDFNDRDWKAATVKPVSTDIASLPANVISWDRSEAGGHIRNGHLRLRSGDHVVMLGGTFIERAQTYGHLESAINAAVGDRKVTFRNLGWSADTVFAESRGIFDSPQKGYERMIEHVRAEEPSVILVCYGQNEAMSFPEGSAGLEKFKTQLGVLHRDLSAAGAEVVYLSPHPFLSVAPPLPNPAHWNGRLKEFASVLKSFASANGSAYVDLYSDLTEDIETVHGYHSLTSPMPVELLEHSELQSTRNGVWTHNGIHWNDSGYARISLVVAARLLGKKLWPQTIHVDVTQKTVTSDAGQIQKAEWSATGSRLVSFEYKPESLSVLPLVVSFSGDSDAGGSVIVESNQSGETTRFVRPKMQGPVQQSDISFVCESSVSYAALQELTIQKNELYFHRWRPQNITYLFGFRKHEQGNNASEIAQFDPLIDELEEQIYAAKLPRWQTITVSTDGDATGN